MPEQEMNDFESLASFFGGEQSAPEAVTEPAESSAPSEAAPQEQPLPDNAEGEAQEAAADTPSETPESTEEGEEPESQDGQDEPRYFTEEDLREKYGKSRPPGELLKYAARVSAEAKEYSEIKEQLGGEAFIPHMAAMSGAIQLDRLGSPQSMNDFLTGVNSAGGEQAVEALIHNALYVGLVNAATFRNNPATKDFGDSVWNSASTAIQTTFGVSVDQIEKMSPWVKSGVIDMLDKWAESGYVDAAEIDEFEKLVSTTKDATKLELLAENRRLKEQLAAATAKPGQTAQADASDFLGYAQEQAAKLGGNLLWKRSTLSDSATDSPDIKSMKATMRGLIETAAAARLAADAKPQVKSDFYAGKHANAVFKTEIARQMDGVRASLAPEISQMEKLIAKLYETKRTSQLAPAPKTPVAKQPPTTPHTVVDERGAAASMDDLESFTEYFKTAA